MRISIYQIKTSLRSFGAVIAGLICAVSIAKADPALESVFNGNDLAGWGQKPSGSFIVNTTDHAIQVSGTARGFAYTTNKYLAYRVIYSVRQINHLHWPCALFFCYSTTLDAGAGVQFQLPNNSSWDYRPGHNVDPHTEGLITSYGKLANLVQTGVWYRCEILVDQLAGTADSSAAFLGGKAVHITKFTDPTITNIACAFAFQSHQSNVHDEFKDVLIEVNPPLRQLVTLALPTPGPLHAAAVSSSRIDLDWTINSTNQTGFKVFHSTDQQAWNLVATLDSQATTYSDVGLSPSTTYYYRVAAIMTNAISDYATTNATTPAQTGDFSIDASPSSQSTQVGGSATYTVTVGAIAGFSGTVTLSAHGVPAGASASFSPPTISGSGTSTLTVATTGATPPNTTTLTITGASGALSHSASVVLSVMDFSLAASPASQTVTAGGSGNFTVTAGSINGFSGTVALSASGLPSGATAAFNPGSIPALGSSTLTIATASSTAAGNYLVTIHGTSGGLAHTTNVTLIVNAASNAAVSFEAESLTWTNSGGTTSLQTDANSSGGTWVQLAATATSQYIEFTTPAIAAGTYKVQMMWKGNNNRGILNLKVDGNQVGGTLDQYSTSQTYPTTVFGNVTFSSTGAHKLRLTVTGKNAASSGMILSADKFTFTPVASTVAFEAENLSFTSGAPTSVQTDTNASNGQWILMSSTATGQFIDYSLPTVPAGTYTVKMSYKSNNNRAIVSLSVDGTTIGGSLDQYQFPSVYPEATFGNVTFGTAGTHTIRLIVTGKNASSSSFTVSADKFTLVGQ
jgi:hypothetical protein